MGLITLYLNNKSGGDLPSVGVFVHRGSTPTINAILVDAQTSTATDVSLLTAASLTLNQGDTVKNTLTPTVSVVDGPTGRFTLTLTEADTLLPDNEVDRYTAELTLTINGNPYKTWFSLGVQTTHLKRIIPVRDINLTLRELAGNVDLTYREFAGDVSMTLIRRGGSSIATIQEFYETGSGIATLVTVTDSGSAIATIEEVT